MKEHAKNNSYALYEGSMLDMAEVIPVESIDSIVTDPPYGLTSITKRFGKEGAAPAQFGTDGAFARLSKGFMGKEWDGSGVEYNIETWRRCYDVLKPGGYLLAFGGTRTYHRIACAIEDAGFEIRDCIMWLYGSGFPKSMNIGLAVDKKLGVESKIIGQSDMGKATNSGSGIYACNNGKDDSMKKVFDVKEAQNEWAGWGTALKPAYEPIIVARKPFKGSLVDNVLDNGVGGVNIDECRIAHDEPLKTTKRQARSDKTVFSDKSCGFKSENTTIASANPHGRFPTNVIHDGSQEVINDMPNTNDKSVSRYFYCAKASKRDRDEGLEDFEEKIDCDRNPELNSANAPINRSNNARRNIHPTVKPTSLMQYLVRLVTPKGGTVLDPFMGSGSTGKAVVYENKDRNANYKFVGIELSEEYCEIAEARIKKATE